MNLYSHLCEECHMEIRLENVKNAWKWNFWPILVLFFVNFSKSWPKFSNRTSGQYCCSPALKAIAGSNVKNDSSNKSISNYFSESQNSHPTHHDQDWLPDHYIISRELTPVWRNVVPIGWQEKRRPETLTAEIPRGFLHLVATTTVSTGYSILQHGGGTSSLSSLTN